MGETAPPDVEEMVIAYLLSDPDVTALVDERIYSDLPPDPVLPLIQVVAFDDTPVTNRPLYLLAATLQISAYADDKGTARDVGAQARASLHIADETPHAGGVITGVTSHGWGYRPDDDYEPAKPRYTFDLTVYCHP